MPSKHGYAPIADGRASAEPIEAKNCDTTSLRKIVLYAILLLSLSLNGILLGRQCMLGQAVFPARTGDSLTNFSRRPRVSRENGYWAQPYVEKNHTISDAAWEAIELGHGIMQIDQQRALASGLAPSRAWKPNRSRAVYAFSAYHALHCTVLVRKFLKDYVRDGKTRGNRTWSHAWHCMEVLREEIMCTADGTIVALPLDPHDPSKALPAGHGEARECADWKYLRDWASEHSAGWASPEDNGGLAQYGARFPGTDGILIPGNEVV